jgi:hypothetical protein
VVARTNPRDLERSEPIWATSKASPALCGWFGVGEGVEPDLGAQLRRSNGVSSPKCPPPRSHPPVLFARCRQEQRGERAKEGRSTDRCGSNEKNASPRKMLGPAVLARVEQANHLVRLRIDARDVRSLVSIAPIAAQTEIFGHGLPAMLASDDVVDRKGEEGVLFLVKAAIFAAIARSLTNERSQSRVHQAGRSLRSRRALDWRIAMKLPADTQHPENRDSLPPGQEDRS